MIETLANLLGVDREFLVSAIRTAAGDNPTMQIQRQMIALDHGNGLPVEHRPTGFTVVIATGMDTDFEMEQEPGDMRGYVKSVTLRFRR
jgi:hypothetical protein